MLVDRADDAVVPWYVDAVVVCVASSSWLLLLVLLSQKAFPNIPSIKILLVEGVAPHHGRYFVGDDDDDDDGGV